MAQRNELVKRAEAAGIDHETIANDSVLEQKVLEAEALTVAPVVKGGDSFNKLVKNQDGTRTWVVASSKEDLDAQVEASKGDALPNWPDINKKKSKK